MRTALIGGASRGLGFGCAQVLAENDFRIVMCARDAANLDRAAEELRTVTSAEIIACPCDFSKRESLLALQEELNSRKILIDVLVNNVGGPPTGLVTETTEEDWESGLDLLFRSSIRLYEMFVPGMRERRWGRVVNILSTTAIEPSPRLAVSSVLRAGLAVFAKLMAWEIAGDGVTVNSIMPGGFETDRYRELERDAAENEQVASGEIRKRVEAGIPLGRMLDPRELGELVAFLSSDRGAALTGLLLPVDGGQMKSV